MHSSLAFRLRTVYGYWNGRKASQRKYGETLRALPFWQRLRILHLSWALCAVRMLSSNIFQYLWYLAWNAYARLFDRLWDGDRYERFCVYLDRKAAVAQERLRVLKEQAHQADERERERREQFEETLFALHVKREALTNPNFVFPNSTKQ